MEHKAGRQAGSESYQDIGHHLGHGFWQGVLLFADAPALLHASQVEVLQTVWVMHSLAGAHCDGLLYRALHRQHAWLGMMQDDVNCLVMCGLLGLWSAESAAMAHFMLLLCCAMLCYAVAAQIAEHSIALLSVQPQPD